MARKALKKHIFLAVIFCMIIIFNGCATYEMTVTEKKDMESEVYSDEWEQYNRTSAMIAELSESDEFRNADYDKRYALAKDLLDELESEGLVEKVEYLEEQGLFTFEYSNGSGGGIRLNDFDKSKN